MPVGVKKQAELAWFFREGKDRVTQTAERLAALLRDVAGELSLAANIGGTHARAQAHKALQVFCGMLGSFVGDLAVLYRASGGICLAGGILPMIRNFLIRSDFLERLLDKGRMRGFPERIPVRLMDHGRNGVLGAAYWHLDTQASPDGAPHARVH